MALSSLSVAVLSLVAACTVLLVKVLWVSRRSLPLPPGPSRIPLLGSILDYPATNEWITFCDASRHYNSDIIYYSILGAPVVVLNSAEAINELLVKRSLIYSNRPPMTMLNQLVGFAWHFAFQPYDDYWKEHRKIFHKELEGPILSSAQRPHVANACRNLLQHIRERPDQILQDIRLYASQIILGITYGIDVVDSENYFVGTAERGMSAMAVSGQPGAFWVDYWPVMQYLPSWMPGAGFKRWAREEKNVVDAMRNVPLKFVEDSLANGTAKPSLASKLLQEMEEDHVNNPEISGNVLGAMYAAGSDTVVSTISTLVLALVKNPDVVRKAQAQIDEIVGHDRLPEFKDRELLPYTTAILKETLRWEPAMPLALAHRVTEDDEYKGYHIPKYSAVIGNGWAILRDSNVYGEDVDAFKPERFLNADGTMNESIPHPDAGFGYGRRVCPGQDLAQDVVWMSLVSILAAFDIRKAVDKRGEVLEPSGEYTNGLFRHPVPFKCSIVPRSPAVEALIGVDDRVGK